MAKFLPILIVLSGLLGGLGAGFALRPDPTPPADATDMGSDTDPTATPTPAPKHDSARELVRLSEQFIIPVLDQGRVAAMMVISLTLDVTDGNAQRVTEEEPRLRNAFLQVMFDHANQGGFGGMFTSSSNMTALRTALREGAQVILGPIVHEVLITEMSRRDT